MTPLQRKIPPESSTTADEQPPPYVARTYLQPEANSAAE